MKDHTTLTTSLMSKHLMIHSHHEYTLSTVTAKAVTSLKLGMDDTNSREVHALFEDVGVRQYVSRHPQLNHVIIRKQ